MSHQYSMHSTFLAFDVYFFNAVQSHNAKIYTSPGTYQRPSEPPNTTLAPMIIRLQCRQFSA